MNASGLSNRKMRTAAGVSAIAAPAISPAAAPARPPARPRTARRTVAHSSPAAATPSSACGTSSDQLLKPKIRPDSPMTHSDAGGLSTVMKFEESSEPKNHAFQFSRPRLHRRRVERVRVAGGAQVPQVEHRHRRQHDEEGRPVPARRALVELP